VSTIRCEVFGHIWKISGLCPRCGDYDGDQGEPDTEEVVVPEPIRQQLVAEQAGRIADLLGVNIEYIAFDSNGIKLTHDQMDLLFTALISQGFKNAASTLKKASSRANADRNLTAWAVYVSAAYFLEDQAELTKPYEPCNCRCRLGRHCGGCGHEGCGYRAKV
jgi:hypothetical protein